MSLPKKQKYRYEVGLRMKKYEEDVCLDSTKPCIMRLDGIN